MSSEDEDSSGAHIPAAVASFTSKLYREMLPYAEDKNITMCPVALSSLLSLVRSGARDETAQEIKKAVNLPQNPKDIEAGVKEAYPTIKKGKHFDYKSANKIYLQSQYSVKKEYKTVAEEVYDIGFEHIDFSQQADSATAMNNFAKSATQGQVDDMVKEADIDNDSQMILVCAGFLKINWTKLQKDASVKRPFKITASKSVTVEFIEKSSMYNYCEMSNIKAQMIELPIEPKLLDLVIVIPESFDGLKLIERDIENVFLKPKFVEQRVNVMLPKFKCEYFTDLRKVLQRLGMKKAFIPEADLRGIIAEKKELCITQVLHKTVVNFDDEITASHHQSIKPVGSVKKLTATSKNFIADRPFLFYVKMKGLIIVAGRIKDPTQYG